MKKTTPWFIAAALALPFAPGAGIAQDDPAETRSPDAYDVPGGDSVFDQTQEQLEEQRRQRDEARAQRDTELDSADPFDPGDRDRFDSSDPLDVDPFESDLSGTELDRDPGPTSARGVLPSETGRTGSTGSTGSGSGSTGAGSGGAGPA